VYLAGAVIVCGCPIWRNFTVTVTVPLIVIWARITTSDGSTQRVHHSGEGCNAVSEPAG